MGGVAVAKVVETYLREPMPTHQLPKSAGQRAGPGRPAVFLGKDVMVVGQADTKSQQALRLFRSMAPQLGHKHWRQCDGPSPAALGFLFEQAPVTRPGAGNDGSPGIQIDRAPTQGTNLAAAQSAENAK